MKIAKILLPAIAVLSFSPLRVEAGPVGPSAEMAARLKKNPTSAWLAHYLPDDRYKIAGGIWKYVSTDLDTYYHRPDSPLMMRQSADRVIGFSSAAEAEEAGYRAAPDASGFMSFGAGATSKGGRVVLSDNLTTVVLPSGWSRTAGAGPHLQYGVSTLDQLIGPKGERVTFGITTFSSSLNIDAGRVLNVDFMNSLESGVRRLSNSIENMSQNAGVVDNSFSNQQVQGQFDQIHKKYKMFKIKVAGVEGIGSINLQKDTREGKRNYVLGRGHKIWNITDYSSRRFDISPLLKTLQLR